MTDVTGPVLVLVNRPEWRVRIALNMVFKRRLCSHEAHRSNKSRYNYYDRSIITML